MIDALGESQIAKSDARYWILDTHRETSIENRDMLKHRLFYGILMTLSFTGIVVLDDPAQRWVGLPAGTILALLIAILIILAQLELANLATATPLLASGKRQGGKIFIPVSSLASILLATTWYWPQFILRSTTENGLITPLLPAEVVKGTPQLYLFSVLAFALLGLLLYQYFCYGTTAVLANCGVNCFSIIYFGLLSGFVLAIRIDFGLWPFLMFIFVVKCSDIGAYAIGTLFGKHKFSPKISPGKTWEGMAGAAATAMLVALAFAAGFDIMVWWLALIFGLCFACIAQAGDLAESMIKRDAEHKDSGNKVPGFGGVLDIVDSPLAAAPFAYLFFMLFT